MNAGEALSIAARWTAEELRRPGNEVQCAFTAGSINALAPGAAFPGSSDVDVWLVLPRIEQLRHRVARHEREGVSLEAGAFARERLASREAVLGDFGLCPNLVSAHVLFDPEGMIERLRQPVALAMAQRRWVRQRCRSVRDHALAFLTPFEQSDDLVYLNAVVCYAVRCLAQLPLVADLRNPTTKLGLAQAREVLVAYGLAEVHEDVLRLCGVAELDDAAVLAAGAHCRAALEEARRWRRTPFMGDANVDALSCRAVELTVPRAIAAGAARELLPWITFLHAHAMIALRNDAPPAVLATWQAAYVAEVARLGAATVDDARGQLLACRPALERMLAVCDDLVARNPRATA